MQNSNNHGQPPTPNGHPRPLATPLGSLNTSIYGTNLPGMGGPVSSSSMYGTPNGTAESMRYSDSMADVVHTPTSHQSHGSHHSLSSMSAQKRAYRQRRKDPSCDACRERKVKCDATDASSCSECTSRQVKCQFTKETNRRMSSMKQVQDLERQLHQARQQINQMKGMLQDSSTNNSQFSAHVSLNLPDGAQQRDRGQPPRAAGNFFKVRRNFRSYGRGVFKPPHAYRKFGGQPTCSDDGPSLPARHVTEYLLSQYKTHLHSYQPIVHWPTFLSEVEDLYQSRTFRGTRKTWMSVFFAILACATLVSDEHLHQVDPNALIESATTLVNTLDDDISLDQARTGLLTSVYFMETNRRSLAWIWLGSATRAAQESGLHLDFPHLSALQIELRKRIWWSIYNWDRLCSLELGQYYEAIDPDVEVSEPTPIEDSMIKQDGFQTLEPGKSTSSSLLALIPVVRLTHQLQRTLKSRIISAATLKIYDDHFTSVMDSYPDPFPIASPTPLDPLLIYTASILQICRFMLYRQNLSPYCRPQEREDAVARCVQVAKDTAHYIWRTTPTAFASGQRVPSHPPDVHNTEWQERIKHAVPSFLVKHWWRCVLILCHVGDFAPALTIVGALNAVGRSKKVNTACGRNLVFYIDLLLQRWQAGRNSEIEVDEEMIAYASGDLQGSNNAAWAWTGSGGPAPLLAHDSSGSSPGRNSSPEQSFTQETAPAALPFLLTDDEEQQWGSWAKIEDMVRQLQRLHASPRPSSRPSSHYSSPDQTRLPHPSSALPPHYPPPGNHVPRSSPGSGSLNSLPPLTPGQSTPSQQLGTTAYHFPPPQTSTSYHSAPLPSPVMGRPPSQSASYHLPTGMGSPSSASNTSASNGGASTSAQQIPVTRISISDII